MVKCVLIILTIFWLNKVRCFHLAYRGIHTYNNSPNCKQNKGILLQESLDVLFGDLLHFPLCLHGAYVNAFPDTLHPAVVKPNMSISANRMLTHMVNSRLDLTEEIGNKIQSPFWAKVCKLCNKKYGSSYYEASAVRFRQACAFQSVSLLSRQK